MMTSNFVDELFRAGVPESKKFELIYRKAATLPPDDLNDAVARLRADCRYARILGALIDASRCEKLAVEELFSGNAVSPKIVTSCKWLYMTESKGFISEDFVRNTLPAASSSCQKRIVNKISKWVTNTDLGDKIWTIVRSRSIQLSSMLLGACSNKLIMKEITRDNHCLSLAQILDILRKRFDSGLELLRTMAEAGKLETSSIHKAELYQFILKRDLKKGTELVLSTNAGVPHGRHLTRKLVELISSKELDLSALLTLTRNLKQRSLARYAAPEIYLECFVENFDPKTYERYDKSIPSSGMLEWLNHLRDEAKLRAIETWYQKRRGSALVDNAQDFPRKFLFLLDEKTLDLVVTRRIELESDPTKFSESDLLFWQSMHPDNEKSFAKQKEHLKGESSKDLRKTIYLNILKSVSVLKRPQFLEKRLRFLVQRTRNDYDSQEALIECLLRILLDEYKFTFSEEIWPLLKELIELQLLRGEDISDADSVRLLLVGLQKVSFQQRDFLGKIMAELNRYLSLKSETFVDIEILSREKEEYFWNARLAFVESLEDTKEVATGGVCPTKLRTFYLALAEHKEKTRNLIRAFPKTMEILTLIVSPRMQSEKFPRFEARDFFGIYKLLEPLLPPGEPLHKDLHERVEYEKSQVIVDGIWKAFSKSKVMTEGIFVNYQGHSDKHFIQLCGRSLLHAEVAQSSKWLAMLNEDIEKNLSSVTSYHIDYRLKHRALIISPEELKAEGESLYPQEAKFDLGKGDSENTITLRRIGLVKTLRYFGDSFLAMKMIMPFMKGDYLSYALPCFTHHLSRMPTEKVTIHLRPHILEKNSAVSARKVMLQGFFGNTFMFDKDAILGVVQQLSASDEHDNIKNETLLAIFRIVENVGEGEGWPILKTCLDSIGVSDRTCFTTTMLSKTSIDQLIPSNLEYLMRKLVEFSESELYVRQYRDTVLHRIMGNVKNLSPAFLCEMIDRIKARSWSRFSIPGSLAQEILMHCVPRHAKLLKAHMQTFGHTEVLDLTNSTSLTRSVTKRLVREHSENAVEVLDFLSDLLKNRSSDDFRELRHLELTKIMLPLLPERREEEDLRSSLPQITLAALRTTADFLEEFGYDLYGFLVDDLKRILDSTFPKLRCVPEWTRYLLDVYNEGLSRTETVILLRLLIDCPFDDDGANRLRELFRHHDDSIVRVAFRNLLELP